MRAILASAVVACVCGAASGSIVNGSFEDRPIAFPDRVSMSNLSSWSASGGSMLHERGVNGVSNIAAHSGVQFVSMGHSGASNDTLTQTFVTTPGATYDVSFAVACIQGDGLQRVTATVLDGANVLGSVQAEVSVRSAGWQVFGLQFTAASASSTLRFVHTLGSGNANVAVDSVAVTPAPAALPLLALGLCGRRRRGA